MHLYTQTHSHRQTHTKCMTDEKAQDYQYSTHQTGPEPFRLCASQPFLSPSLAGEVAFNLEDREQGASARLEKNTKQQP